MSEAVAIGVEALGMICQTAVQAAGVNVKDRVSIVPALPDANKWMLINRDGKETLLDKSDPARKHTLLSCQETVAFSKYAADKLKWSPIVWISDTGVVVTNDSERIIGQRAEYAFRKTPEFLLLESLKGSAETKSQSDMIRLLRVDMVNLFADDADRVSLLKSVRKLRTTQRSAVSNGAGSYDASMVTEAGEKIEWPDELDLVVRVFDDLALTVPAKVRVAIETDAVGKSFTITPITSDMNLAIQETRDHASEVIREQLKETAIPAFLGMP